MRRISIWALGFLVIGTAAFAGAQFFNPSGSFSQTYAVLMNLSNGLPYDATNPLPTTASVSVTVGNITPAPATAAAGTASVLSSANTSTVIITGPVNGCWVTNPQSATDQAIATAEVVEVNFATTAAALGNGTTITLQPGQAAGCVPGQVTNVSARAVTAGHSLSLTKW